MSRIAGVTALAFTSCRCTISLGNIEGANGGIGSLGGVAVEKPIAHQLKERKGKLSGVQTMPKTKSAPSRVHERQIGFDSGP